MGTSRGVLYHTSSDQISLIENLFISKSLSISIPVLGTSTQERMTILRGLKTPKMINRKKKITKSQNSKDSHKVKVGEADENQFASQSLSQDSFVLDGLEQAGGWDLTVWRPQGKEEWRMV